MMGSTNLNSRFLTSFTVTVNSKHNLSFECSAIGQRYSYQEDNTNKQKKLQKAETALRGRRAGGDRPAPDDGRSRFRQVIFWRLCYERGKRRSLQDSLCSIFESGHDVGHSREFRLFITPRTAPNMRFPFPRCRWRRSRNITRSAISEWPSGSRRHYRSAEPRSRHASRWIITPKRSVLRSAFGAIW